MVQNSEKFYKIANSTNYFYKKVERKRKIRQQSSTLKDKMPPNKLCTLKKLIIFPN